jgi:class 3 adenylate cyclase
MALCVDEATSGELVISAECFEQIKGCTISKKLRSGSHRVLSLTDAPQLFRKPPPFISVEMEGAMNTFLQPIVKEHVEFHGSGKWLAEFKECTIMFIALSGLDYSKPNATLLAMLEKQVKIVQEAVHTYQGVVARLIADDKGTRFKIAFGMPGRVYADSAARCIHCGLACMMSLRKMGCPPAIGIASGTVFCGDAGSRVRCEYTAVGFKVILAARLMGKAGFGGILADETSYDQAKSEISFEPLAPIVLKGVAQPVPIFIPHNISMAMQAKSSRVLGLSQEKGFRHRLQVSSQQQSFIKTSRRRSLVPGIAAKDPQVARRKGEQDFLHAQLRSVAADGLTRVVLFEGEAGMGKSMISLDFFNSLKNKANAASARCDDWRVGATTPEDMALNEARTAVNFWCRLLCTITGKEPPRARVAPITARSDSFTPSTSGSCSDTFTPCTSRASLLSLFATYFVARPYL